MGELQAALEEAEGTLEQEENKVLRAQLELSQMKQEIERRIAQKEDEFMMIRKNQTKALESMQAALEVETKSKTEAMRMKKKLETDVLDLEAGLEHANAANAETQKTIQKYALQVRDDQAKLDEESHAKSAAHDALAAAKRKMEQEMTTMNADLDEMAHEAQMAEERAQKAMIDAARLADELRIEQDTAMPYERDRKLLEAQVKDIVARCDDAETNALKGGKKAVAKMETRIRELESEMDAEQRRYGDAQKNMRKSERHVKELIYQQEEDKKNHERMQALVD